MEKRGFHSPAFSYILWGILLWIFVDFGTAGGFKISYLIHFGPALWIFYLGYPLLFAYLIYRKQWKGGKLFLATLAAIFIVEVVMTRNPLILSFPLLLIGIPLSICIYTPLTFFPRWIVHHELGKHRLTVAFLSFIIFTIMFLTTFGTH